MKLLLDMNISPRWVKFLQANGVEAIHWDECGAPDASDGEIIDYARENGFIVFTSSSKYGSKSLILLVFLYMTICCKCNNFTLLAFSKLELLVGFRLSCKVCSCTLSC